MSTPQPDSHIAAAFAPVRTLEPTEAEVAAVLRRVQAPTSAANVGQPRRLRPGAVGPLLGGLAAVAVVLVALVLVRHAAPPAGSDSRGAVPGAQALVSRLAVLRRPQTAADRTMPALAGPEATAVAPLIVPRYTRLVASPPGARAFLVVTKPALPGLWSSRFGDDVGVVIVAGGYAGYRRGFPAADLHDPANVFGESAGYLMGVFPDGVARVRWTFRNPVGGPERVVTERVAGNVAVASRPSGARELWSAVWYGADGRVVPTSERLLEQVTAARQAERRAAALARAQRSRSRIAPALLAKFPVFAAGSGRPAPASSGAEAGLTVAHPSLSSLPVGILGPLAPGGTDLRQVRLVTTAAGLQFWIMPGARDACLFQLESPVRRSPLIPATVTGAGGECAAGLAQIEQSGGMWDTQGQFTFGFVAGTNRSVTLITRGGASQTVPVIDGVFVARTSGFVRVRLRSATGKLVTSP